MAPFRGRPATLRLAEATSLTSLAPIEILEEPVGRSNQILILGEIVRFRLRAAQQFGEDFLPFRLRKGLEPVDQLLD